MFELIDSITASHFMMFVFGVPIFTVLLFILTNILGVDQEECTVADFLGVCLTSCIPFINILLAAFLMHTIFHKYFVELHCWAHETVLFNRRKQKEDDNEK